MCKTYCQMVAMVNTQHTLGAAARTGHTLAKAVINLYFCSSPKVTVISIIIHHFRHTTSTDEHRPSPNVYQIDCGWKRLTSRGFLQPSSGHLRHWPSVCGCLGHCHFNLLTRRDMSAFVRKRISSFLIRSLKRTVLTVKW